MKNKIIPLLICFTALLFTFSLNSCTYSEGEVIHKLEQAYFEGQKDALNGDVRIRKNGDSCWIWTKSCWDNGKQPTFNPSIVCDGK